MIQPKAIVAVTNDLTTDQRVHRTCTTLLAAGYEVLLVGRRRTNSRTLEPRDYAMHRLQLLFEKGPLFYAEYNIRLFFFLIIRKHNLLVSNDLDTLPGVYMAHVWAVFFNIPRALRKSKALGLPSGHDHLHDCHEYFRGVPELVGRPSTIRIWKFIEDSIFPKLRMVTAVNQSIAGLYRDEYGKGSIVVVRNLPFRKHPGQAGMREQLQIGPERRIIFYQGAVNLGRGLEEAVLAMKHVGTDALLVIAGTGDIYGELMDLVTCEQCREKVFMLGEIPFRELHEYTLMADIGLSIEKDLGINYRFALPNKMMDYIQARVPLLVSPFPEMKAVVQHYDIGRFIDGHDPHQLAAVFDEMLQDEVSLARYKKNLEVAAAELCWEAEQEKLLNLLQTAR